MKTALITGVTGQDGAYLARFLLEKGYRVYGMYRRTSSPNMWRLLYFDLMDKITLIPGDMTDMASISNAIILSKPDEIYNLAAQSFVGTSFEQPILTGQVDGIGVLHLLECVKQYDQSIKLYQASTSELFGNKPQAPECQEVSLSESSRLWPASPYAAAKLYSYHLMRIYREAYGMFCVNGILFNHESPLRGLEFVTRKVTNAVARIKLGLDDHVELGFLDAERDWGYAAEYVEAMWLMLQQDEPEDFTIATGASYSVRELCRTAFSLVGLDYEPHVRISEKHKRCIDVYTLCGDASQAKEKLGWEATTNFHSLVELMLEADLKRWTDWQAGRLFPWDAINHANSY